MTNLDHYLNKIKTLPPAPRILSQLLALLSEDDIHAERVVELIKFDPGLTAKVLEHCNNTARGLAYPVHDLPHAITCIGFNDIYRIVAAAVLESTLGVAQKGYGLGAGELWQHSVATALAARIIALNLSLDENLTFTAALLHDIGKIVLGVSLEGAYDAIMTETEGSDHSFQEAEKIILGADHAEIGGQLLERWNFPENLVNAVRHHHNPPEARPHEQLAACVHLGDMTAHILGYGYGHQAFAVRARGEVMSILEITPAEIETFTLQTAAAVEESIWLKPTTP